MRSDGTFFPSLCSVKRARLALNPGFRVQRQPFSSQTSIAFCNLDRMEVFSLHYVFYDYTWWRCNISSGGRRKGLSKLRGKHRDCGFKQQTQMHCTPPTLTRWHSRNSFSIEQFFWCWDALTGWQERKSSKASVCILKFACNSLFFLNRRKETRRCYQESRNPCIEISVVFRPNQSVKKKSACSGEIFTGSQGDASALPKIRWTARENYRLVEIIAITSVKCLSACNRVAGVQIDDNYDLSPSRMSSQLHPLPVAIHFKAP